MWCGYGTVLVMTTRGTRVVCMYVYPQLPVAPTRCPAQARYLSCRHDRYIRYGTEHLSTLDCVPCPAADGGWRVAGAPVPCLTARARASRKAHSSHPSHLHLHLQSVTASLASLSNPIRYRWASPDTLSQPQPPYRWQSDSCSHSQLTPCSWK